MIYPRVPIDSLRLLMKSARAARGKKADQKIAKSKRDVENMLSEFEEDTGIPLPRE